jgi:hypothetical protein
MTMPGVLLVATCFVVGWLVPVPRLGVPIVAVTVAILVPAVSSDLYHLWPKRRTWAHAWDVRDAELRSAGPGQAVKVRAFYNYDDLDDFGPDPTFWVNSAAAQYYGVKSIEATVRAGSAAP